MSGSRDVADAVRRRLGVVIGLTTASPAWHTVCTRDGRGGPMRPLSVLLPLLVSCVETHSSCEDFEGGTFQDDATFGVTQEELDAAVDADGELTEEGCADL